MTIDEKRKTVLEAMKAAVSTFDGKPEQDALQTLYRRLKRQFADLTDADIEKLYQIAVSEKN